METQLGLWETKTAKRWARIVGDGRLCRLAYVVIGDDDVLLTVAVRRKAWLIPDSYRFRGAPEQVVRDCAAMLDRLTALT